MSDHSFQLQDETLQALRKGDLRECDRIISNAMRNLPLSPFHIVLDLDFTNSPPAFAALVNAFHRRQSSLFKVAAIYTETNGFEINTDLWFCHLFAYPLYGGHEDYDWLSNWASEDFPLIALTGMEPLQAVYASAAFSESEYRSAAEVAGLLVVSRFQQLVHRSAPHMNEVTVPLLSTAHDYDYIAETLPSERH